ncbi:hypothetical protein KM043_018592 [Ampulex compressa]|nr:hypothetical protein KM043_018592 [Ampulex compressa]
MLLQQGFCSQLSPRIQLSRYHLDPLQEEVRALLSRLSFFKSIFDLQVVTFEDEGDSDSTYLHRIPLRGMLCE